MVSASEMFTEKKPNLQAQPGSRIKWPLDKCLCVYMYLKRRNDEES